MPSSWCGRSLFFKIESRTIGIFPLASSPSSITNAPWAFGLVFMKKLWVLWQYPGTDDRKMKNEGRPVILWQCSLVSNIPILAARSQYSRWESWRQSSEKKSERGKGYSTMKQGPTFLSRSWSFCCEDHSRKRKSLILIRLADSNTLRWKVRHCWCRLFRGYILQRCCVWFKREISVCTKDERTLQCYPLQSRKR